MEIQSATTNDRLTSSHEHLCLDHDWQPIAGWYARYRCAICKIVGYKPRVVTVGVEGGPYGSARITPYVCAATRSGAKCGCPAQARRKGTWKCREHLLNRATSTARSALAQKETPAPPHASRAPEGITQKSTDPLSCISPPTG